MSAIPAPHIPYLAVRRSSRQTARNALLWATLICVAAAPRVLAVQAVVGQPLAEFLEAYRADGFPIVYSTDLVTRTLRVETVPAASDDAAELSEVLREHGLALRLIDGVYYVVREVRAAPRVVPGSILAIVKVSPSGDRLNGATLSLGPSAAEVTPLSGGAYQINELAPGDYRLTVAAPAFRSQSRDVRVRAGRPTAVIFELEEGEAQLQTLTISASHYDLMREFKNSFAHFTQDEVQNMPDLGEDPLRVVQRLPGSAAGGLSARSHIRGGDDNEMLLIYEGLELIEPFHIRDYQSIFSTIDQRAISDVQIYTGGFPVDYGGSMSGVMLIEPLVADGRRHELGLSLYNTSILTSGTFADGRGDWLGTARRGNLDLVVDPEFGQPSYSDLLGRVGWEFGEASRLSLNALVSNDDIKVIVEDDPGDRERSNSDTSNDQYWIKVDTRWNDALTSRTVVSNSNFRNMRQGFIDEDDKISGNVSDRRSLDVLGIRQDWNWVVSENNLAKWGVHFRRLEADLDYSSSAEYFELYLGFPGVQPVTTRATVTQSDGESYSVYFADRMRISPRMTAELGLRWDKQTYLGSANDDQLSPRINFLYKLGDNTEIRGSWGRFYQAQEIQALQIEDGVTNYFPAQRADHSILSVEHRFANEISVRVEAYSKEMNSLWPRYENLFDPLVLMPELNPDRVRIAPESASARGMEVFVTGETDSPLSWWASAAFSRTEDRDSGSDVPRSWDQRRAFDAGINYSGNKWDFNVAAKYRSGWPTTGVDLTTEFPPDGSSVPEFSYGPRNAERLSSFQSLDFRASRRFDVTRGSLSVFVEVINALNRENTCCVDWDAEPDDNGIWELERSEDFWLPRLPAIGILWEF